jgi:hypothetical protein
LVRPQLRVENPEMPVPAGQHYQLTRRQTCNRLPGHAKLRRVHLVVGKVDSQHRRLDPTDFGCRVVVGRASEVVERVIGIVTTPLRYHLVIVGKRLGPVGTCLLQPLGIAEHDRKQW